MMPHPHVVLETGRRQCQELRKQAKAKQLISQVAGQRPNLVRRVGRHIVAIALHHKANVETPLAFDGR